MKLLVQLVVSLLILLLLGSCKGCNITCDFYYTNGSTVCTRLRTNALIHIKYYNDSRKVSEATLCLPCNSTVTGTCNTTTHGSSKLYNSLELSWEDDDNGEYSLTFNFSKSTKKGKKHWTMDSAQLTVATEFEDSKREIDFSANASASKLVGDLDYKRSYSCKHNQTLKLKVIDQPPGNKHKYNASVVLGHFKVQAFEFSNSTSGKFGNAAQCPEDPDVSKIVPIAVGSALGGLVLVVLVAYVIGKLRSKKQSSYEPLS